MRSHTMKGAWAALACVMVVGMLFAGGTPGRAADAGSLTFTVAGGTFEKWERSVLIATFEKETGAHVNVVAGLTMTNLAKLRASRGNPQIDVVTFDPPGAIPAAKEGLLEKLNPAKIPNLRNVYPWAKPQYDTLAPDYLFYECIAYNTNLIKSPPTSFNDLWNPEYQGKVLIPDISQGHSYLLVAELSKMLTGGKDFYDADAAFKKLATLKPSILTYWTSHDQVAQLLNSGQAWIAAWGIDRSITQRMQGAPINCVIPKEGDMKIVSNIGIAKGSAHQALAEKFINLWLSPEIQQSMANNVILAPIVKNVKLTGVVGDAFAPAKLQALDSPDWDRLIPLEPKWAEIWNQMMVK